jgi:type II secretory pathway predicted ATPase ExeA
MYEAFFCLTHRPFAAAAAAERYIPTQSLEQARTTLVRVIDRAEGPGLVVGPAGTGKSLVCQLLAQHFRGRFLVALLASARLSSRRALLQNILFELKLPYRDLDESELRLSLVDHLEPRTGGHDGLLLLVDEAHTLPLRLWEEIRLITNLIRDGQPRLRLVMAGGMAMEERLANPKLESFQQRIAARCYLQPMNRDETIYYVEEQLRRAGADPAQLFTESALKAIHTASDGIPRLVNQVCDHALMLAALGGHKQLGASGIQEAWADLQQLPVPWREPVTPSAQQAGAHDAAKEPAVVEFGQLDENINTAVTQVGPFRSIEADSAAVQLDTIENGLSALREDSGTLPAEFTAEPLPKDGEPDDFSPADERDTEVELIFHSAHDPFGGDWQEEEVIIDRYAMLEETRLRRVASDEGRQIGAALYAASPPPRPKLAETPDDADEASPEHQLTATVSELQAELAAFDPASDPLLPEESSAELAIAAQVTIPAGGIAAEGTAAASGAARRAGMSLRDLAGDDRDIIVVEDKPPPPPAAPPASPKRREYRQLFSTLRKR